MTFIVETSVTNKRFFSELLSPGRSHYTSYWYSWIAKILMKLIIDLVDLATHKNCSIKMKEISQSNNKMNNSVETKISSNLNQQLFWNYKSEH